MQTNNLPVLKFTPIFKSVIWGGKRIAEYKGLPSQGDHVGESWELSPMKGNESVVSEGEYKGKTLPELMASHGKEIMGERLFEKYGTHFPFSSSSSTRPMTSPFRCILMTHSQKNAIIPSARPKCGIA